VTSGNAAEVLCNTAADPNDDAYVATGGGGLVLGTGTLPSTISSFPITSPTNSSLQGETPRGWRYRVSANLAAGQTLDVFVVCAPGTP
jgi:hypothetical protein